LQSIANRRLDMADDFDKYREEAKEVAAATHGAARDDRDARQDRLSDRLLGMYEKAQDAMFTRMAMEGDTVREIKEGLARVEKQVDEFVKAFPEGDPVKHRLGHEADLDFAKTKKYILTGVVVTVVAMLTVAAIVWVISVAVWPAFLHGPKL